MKYYFTKKYLIDLSNIKLLLYVQLRIQVSVCKSHMIFIFTVIRIINVYLDICINDSNIYLSKYNTIGKKKCYYSKMLSIKMFLHNVIVF